MKPIFKILGTVTILILVACKNNATDTYIKGCEKASKITKKQWGEKIIHKSDKLWANAHCTCRSQGLQSILTVDEFDSLVRATKAGKAHMFRVSEQAYLSSLIRNNPDFGKEVGEVRSVCRRYAVEVKRNYREKELPSLPLW